ncbi:hypothetical protein B0A50_01407 [Salinomyces thailandicus]|uniref:Uncharacterized protein n=1 Tax=Salinomyces thailandicus TaxID=706561 RepID=A0A4V5N818_9PEZI|nr:hypothetical protein B0A50_01407 [Salinomyces thailandica]
MSSGNPFRRPPQSSRLPDEPSATFQYEQQRGEEPYRPSTPPPPKSKKKKKVVIQTPPHSPEEPIPRIPPRRVSDGRTGSPPPAAMAPATSVTKLQNEEGDADSITSADSDLQEAFVNTRKNSGTGVLPPPAVSFGVNRPIDKPGTSSSFGSQAGARAGVGGGAPYNPFARTLETQEAAFGLQKPTKEDEKVEDERGRQGRQTLDVDAFKNILMTGSATPSPPVGQSGGQGQQQKVGGQDTSSSSTDTSSISRQSMFDQPHEVPHPESPRTSFDEHEHPRHSDSDDGDDEDTEQSSLMGPAASRPVEEGPPRPPKHTHGRPFPQTVSFADFDTDLPPGPRTLPVGAGEQLGSSGQGSERPSTPRSPSDLNKPLPPPPQRDTPEQHAKRPAPPPPASRRPGQSATAQGRARSASNLSQGSTQQAGSDTSSIRGGDGTSKAAPPPPPSRRSQQAASPALETPPPAPSPSRTPSDPMKTMPPPPPRRHSSKMALQSTTPRRSPSTSSKSSLPRGESFTNDLPGSSPGKTPAEKVPPAPPPRRGGGGGGGKRSSMDGPPNALSNRRFSAERRTSGQSLGSETSSLRRVGEDEPAEPPPTASPEASQRDVLADMQAFQDEIDALRRAQGGG